MGLMVWPIHRVDNQDVLPSVVVIVEETGAVAHGLRQVLLSERAAIVLERDARLSRHVSELNRPRRPRIGGTGPRRQGRRWGSSLDRANFRLLIAGWLLGGFLFAPR